MLDLTKKLPYQPDERTAKFILDAYTDYLYDYNLRGQKMDILDGRTLQQFWNDSEKDYNVIVGIEDPNDPVSPYSSSISRDKANSFISTLTQQLLFPSVAAQNSNQEIDRVVSRVSRSILEWQHLNDGRPAESGISKNADYIHNAVITGTTHIQDDVDEEGKLVSSFVPNEEIFIQNFYCNNIQLQPHLLRVQNIQTYDQAEIEFGVLKNYNDYVIPMSASGQFWLREQSEFQQIYQAINPKDGIHIMRIWRTVPRVKLSEYKKSGKLPAYVKKAKYFNVIINGVLMFDAENLMPYHHGNYPVSKGIFEKFSRVQFYYGNSLPNKARVDKKWLDGWKQLVRYKAKLSTLPPLITLNGSFVDPDIVVPGMITQAPAGMGKDDIIAIPGLSNGLSAQDFQIMNDGVSDIDRATTSPQATGQNSSSRITAREALLLDANAQKALQGFGLQIGFLVEARTFPILSMSYQFLPRSCFNKLCVPDQQLPGGATGSMEVMFIAPVAMTEDQIYDTEMAIFQAERKSAKEGNPKKIVLINQEYVMNLDYYVKCTVDSLVKETAPIREARAEMHFDKYSTRPDIFNIKAAGRKLVQEFGDDETEMLINNEQTTPPPMPMETGVSGQGSGSGQNPLTKMNQQQSSKVADNSAPLPTY